eukprot:491881-Pleurochrysis_carterae.AAC.1
MEVASPRAGAERGRWSKVGGRDRKRGRKGENGAGWSKQQGEEAGQGSRVVRASELLNKCAAAHGKRGRVHAAACALARAYALVCARKPSRASLRPVACIQTRRCFFGANRLCSHACAALPRACLRCAP